MEFRNENISPDMLPSINSVQFYPLERGWLTVKRLSLLLMAIVLVLAGTAAFYFIKKLQVPAIMWSAAGIFAFLLLINWISDGISFRNSGYALRDKDILYRRGWIIRKSRVVPLNRIQHVSVQSGPIERKFGLASVTIFTAGSGGADFTIHGISEQKAQQIKDWISNQLNGASN